MKNELKKENIKKNIATIALVATLVTGSTGIGIKVYDKNIDHTKEYCPLCNILGMEHQVDAIVSNTRYSGLSANLETINQNGDVVLVSSGITLNPDNLAEKYINSGEEYVRIYNINKLETLQSLYGTPLDEALAQTTTNIIRKK